MIEKSKNIFIRIGEGRSRSSSSCAVFLPKFRGRHYTTIQLEREEQGLAELLEKFTAMKMLCSYHAQLSLIQSVKNYLFFFTKNI